MAGYAPRALTLTTVRALHVSPRADFTPGAFSALAKPWRLATPPVDIFDDWAHVGRELIGNTPQFWLNLQAEYDVATLGRKMRRELKGISPLKAA